VPQVTSQDNPRLVEAGRLLASGRARRKSGRCVLEGEHLVTMYLARCGVPLTLLVLDGAPASPALATLVRAMPTKDVLRVPRALLATVVTTSPDVGVLAVVPMPAGPVASATTRHVLLDGVQDPGNVGTILRTAAAAGVEHVLLGTGCASAWSPKALRAGQGAQFLVSITEDADLVAWVRTFHAAGGTMVATGVVHGADLYATPIAAPWAIAIGNEGAGLSPALAAAANLAVTIPMPGGMESLNAAAAAAVVLFELVRRQRSTGYCETHSNEK